MIEMTCDVIEHTERKPLLSLDAVVRFTSSLFRGAVASRPVLDVNALPDHIKRDMGFMDGRGPYGNDAEAQQSARRLFNSDELPRI
ncbi:hypothetical protein [Ensifer sp.]|uniref:hypothetical protein n=1 Tax=Ensifer sp. TaxID=1872086 RepID=UPI000DD6B6C4|nr:hypothetical protein [Ensifer sp.]